MTRWGISNLVRVSPRSTAASRELERVVREERSRLTRVMCWLRFALATVNALAVVPIVDVEGYSATWPSRYGAVVYWLLSGAVLAMIRLRPSTVPIATFAPVFVDIPLIGGIEYLQTTMALSPGVGTPASVSILLGFMMVSMLTLSRTVMVAVTPPTIVLLWLIASVEHVPVPVRLTITVMTIGVGMMGWYLVGRIRALVRLSRQHDLLGKYVLGPRVGVGGMAEVFSATYSPEGGFERKVAVKRILPGYSENEEAVALFRREAELGARLTHPNVVQVFDFGADGSTYFLAMEYVEGASLAKVLGVLRTHQTPLSLSAVVYLADQLASGLEYVHSRTGPDGAPLNLVHRDFNPPNVLLSTIGEVKIADFGIARVADRPSLTQPGMMRGKLAYAAPEQLENTSLDARADLFAFGATLIEIATLERAFRGENETEMLTSLMASPILPLRARRPDVPALLSDAVVALMERDLTKRTQSAALFRAVLTPLVFEYDSSNTGRAHVAAAVRAALTLEASKPASADVATVPGVAVRAAT